MKTAEHPPKDEEKKQTMLFAQLIELLTQNAIMMLGGAVDRQGRQRPPDLGAAELMIDILSVLKAKTKGNLTAEEERMLSSTLFQLQSAFAEVASKSGEFGKARKATEAAADEDEVSKSSTPQSFPTKLKSPEPQHQGVQSSGPESDETKVKFTKKYG